MSFKGPATVVTHGLNNHGSAAAGRRVYEESNYEKAVRRNIQQIRTNLQSTEEHLENLSRQMVSRRIVETLHERLKETYEVVVETEQIFKDWTIHLAGDPFEKHRRKFSFEKLSAHFHTEVERVKEISERVQKAATIVAENTSRPLFGSGGSAAQTPPRAGASEGPSGGSTGGSGGAFGDFATGALYDDFLDGDEEGRCRMGEIVLVEGETADEEKLALANSAGGVAAAVAAGTERKPGENAPCLPPNAHHGRGFDTVGRHFGVNKDVMVASGSVSPLVWQPLPCVATATAGRVTEMAEASEQESLIQASVADDRLRGIKRIQHQVCQANQIFRDLASLVTQQDAQLETVDTHMQNVNTHTRGATSELKKAYNLQKNSRQRQFVVVLIMVLVVLVVYYIVHIPTPSILASPTHTVSMPKRPSASPSAVSPASQTVPASFAADLRQHGKLPPGSPN